MISPCKAHFQKTLAAVSAVANEGYVDANPYELMLMQLADHKRQLKAIQSIQRKIAVKATLLPDYDAYIEGVLEGNTGVQDDVLMTLLLWHMDTGGYDHALVMAHYAMTHDLNTPDGHKRDTATLVVEEFAEAVLKDGPAISIAQLQAIHDLTQERDMPDEVRAKLHKALGITCTEANQLAAAQAHFKQALHLHEKCGVKKLLEKLERDIKAQQDVGPDESNEPDEPAAPVVVQAQATTPAEHAQETPTTQDDRTEETSD